MNTLHADVFLKPPLFSIYVVNTTHTVEEFLSFHYRPKKGLRSSAVVIYVLYYRTNYLLIKRYITHLLLVLCCERRGSWNNNKYLKSNFKGKNSFQHSSYFLILWNVHNRSNCLHSTCWQPNLSTPEGFLKVLIKKSQKAGHLNVMIGMSV